jgi:hypothetical protein
MPKAKNMNGKVAIGPKKRTFRIGGRKGGEAGHEMSTEALKKVLEDANKKRYWANARQVLRLRGVEV